MHQPIQFKTTIPHPISRWLPLRRSLVLIPLVLACFGFSPAMQAVSPPPDGGYTGANTAEGTDALFSLTSGLDNTAVGYRALYSTTTGGYNTAAGFLALRNNTTGTRNTAIGYQALYLNTTGSYSVGIGLNTLYHNTTGSFNSANGYYALYNNTTGSSNVANGLNALYANTSGSENTANGLKALFSNTTGQENNAVGFQALRSNVVGFYNNAVGREALFSSTGDENNAMGDLALENNTTGSSNTAIGDDALRNLTSGDFNVAIGDEAGTVYTTVDNVICIGSPGDGTAFTTPDRTFIGNIRGVTVGNGDGIAVIVDSDGQLGTTNSSRRFKNDIKPMDQTSEAILALKPVTFHYKNEDTKKAENTPQFGLIAEDVAEVNSDLVVLDADGKPFTVRYDAVNAMLLNEFLKEHKKVQNLEATVAQQQKGMEVLTAQLKEQAAQIQKVSAQVELNKRAPRTVANK